jgi:hypothetical protein
VALDEDDMKIAQIESGALPKVEEEKDGGYGWLVVLGAFCVQVTTFGMCNSWGKLKEMFVVVDILKSLCLKELCKTIMSRIISQTCPT